MKFKFCPTTFTHSRSQGPGYRGVIPTDWRTLKSLVTTVPFGALLGIELAERVAAIRVTSPGKVLLADLAQRFGPLPSTLSLSCFDGSVSLYLFRVGNCVYDSLSLRSGLITRSLEYYVRCSVIIDSSVTCASESTEIAELPTWGCWLLMRQLPPGTNTYHGYRPWKTNAQRGLQEMEPVSARHIAARRLQNSRSTAVIRDRFTALGHRLAWTVLTQCDAEIDRATWLVGWLLGHVRTLGLTLADLDDPNLLDAIDAMVAFAQTATARHPKHVDVTTRSWPGRVFHIACDEIDRCYNPRRRLRQGS
jgi:hypothetical protein